MNIIRKDVLVFFQRYSDALVGACVSFFGVNWALSAVGFMSMLGIAMTVAGALLTFAGIQRARFRCGDSGPGVVTIDEGQVTYFGPLDGGTVHIDELTQIDLAPSETIKGTYEWLLLARSSAEPLRIPANAVGADALFDVFTRLEGVRTNKLLSQINQKIANQIVIWRRRDFALD